MKENLVYRISHRHGSTRQTGRTTAIIHEVCNALMDGRNVVYYGADQRHAEWLFKQTYWIMADRRMPIYQADRRMRAIQLDNRALVMFESGRSVWKYGNHAHSRRGRGDENWLKFWDHHAVDVFLDEDRRESMRIVKEIEKRSAYCSGVGYVDTRTIHE